jgi:hypothetical protein
LARQAGRRKGQRKREQTKLDIVADAAFVGYGKTSFMWLPAVGALATVIERIILELRSPTPISLLSNWPSAGVGLWDSQGIKAMSLCDLVEGGLETELI